MGEEFSINHKLLNCRNVFGSLTFNSMFISFSYASIGRLINQVLEENSLKNKGKSIN